MIKTWCDIKKLWWICKNVQLNASHYFQDVLAHFYIFKLIMKNVKSIKLCEGKLTNNKVWLFLWWEGSCATQVHECPPFFMSVLRRWNPPAGQAGEWRRVNNGYPIHYSCSSKCSCTQLPCLICSFNTAIRLRQQQSLKSNQGTDWEREGFNRKSKSAGESDFATSPLSYLTFTQECHHEAFSISPPLPF